MWKLQNVEEHMATCLALGRVGRLWAYPNTDYIIAKLLNLPSTASPQGLMYVSAFRLHPSAVACSNVLACLL